MMYTILYLCSLGAETNSDGEGYGMDLELLDFQSVQNNKGFEANFGLHVDVNYIFFGLMRKGDTYNHDRLASRLNNEYSMNSSQKKGSTFTIIKQYKMRNLENGQYFFQLESQDGNVYKSNVFSLNPDGVWVIKRATGIPKSKMASKKLSWFDKYKYYVIGVSVALLLCLIFLGYKAYYNKTE